MDTNQKSLSIHPRSQEQVFKEEDVSRVLSPELKKELKEAQRKKEETDRLRISLDQQFKSKFVFGNNLNRKQYSYSYDGPNPFLKYVHESTFDNQRNFGCKIAKSFVKNSQLLNSIAIAPTQSGKTGSMLATMYWFMRYDPIKLPRENIFIFTPHSSKEWLLQTRERFPKFFSSQIYHRNNLTSFIKRVKNLKNVLIIIDECHIASKFNQTLHKMYIGLNLYNIKSAYERNIKLINFTATPEGLHTELKEHWKEACMVCDMDVPDNYLSHEKLQKDNRVFKMKDLCCYSRITDSISPEAYENIKEIIPHMGDEPKHHIIRTPRGEKHTMVINNFRKVFGELKKNYVYYSEPELSKFQSMDELMNTKPERHTFIFIKDKLRCAKTLNHKYLGVLYERWVQKTNSSCILQGLYGRLTGYHNNKTSVVFSVPIDELSYVFKHKTCMVPC